MNLKADGEEYLVRVGDDGGPEVYLAKQRTWLPLSLWAERAQAQQLAAAYERELPRTAARALALLDEWLKTEGGGKGAGLSLTERTRAALKKAGVL